MLAFFASISSNALRLPASRRNALGFLNTANLIPRGEGHRLVSDDHQPASVLAATLWPENNQPDARSIDTQPGLIIFIFKIQDRGFQLDDICREASDIGTRCSTVLDDIFGVTVPDMANAHPACF
ncbi:MAG: hypothetical protein OXC68_13795 [Aestuariivita sp.]|nr:hypothetical protein [Aestuariivita sp.]